MPKIIKLEGFDEDLPVMLAIGAPMKDYQFALKLRQQLDEHEIKQEEALSYFSKKYKSELLIPYFSMVYEEYQTLIISNKINNKAVIPKYESADFFIVSDDPHWETDKDLIAIIKKITGVTFVLSVPEEHSDELLLLREGIEMQQLEEKKRNKLTFKQK